MVYSVNSHTNAARIGWNLWEIDFRFGPGLPPGWCPEWMGASGMASKGVDGGGLVGGHTRPIRREGQPRACSGQLPYNASLVNSNINALVKLPYKCGLVGGAPAPFEGKVGLGLARVDDGKL